MSASVFAPIIILAILITFFGVKEPDVNKPNETAKKSAKEAIKDFIYGLKDTFTNKALVLVLFMYLFSWLIINMVQNNIYLWVKNFHRLSNVKTKYCLKEEDSFSYILLTIQVSAAIFLVVFQKLSEKIGKKATFLIGSIVFLSPLSALYFIPENGIIYAYICAFLSGMKNRDFFFTL